MGRHILEEIIHISCMITSGTIIIGSIFWADKLGADMFVWAVILFMVSANALKKITELEWAEDELEKATNRADMYKEISKTWQKTATEAMGKLPHRKTYIGSREIMHESVDAEADTGAKKDRTVSCTEDNAVKVGDSTLYAYDIDEICNIIGKRIHAYPAFREAVKKIIQDEKPV